MLRREIRLSWAASCRELPIRLPIPMQLTGKMTVKRIALSISISLFGDTSASVSCSIGRKRDFQTVLVLRSSCGLVGNGSKFWREKSLELRANLGRGK